MIQNTQSESLNIHCYLIFNHLKLWVAVTVNTTMKMIVLHYWHITPRFYVIYHFLNNLNTLK